MAATWQPRRGFSEEVEAAEEEEEEAGGRSRHHTPLNEAAANAQSLPKRALLLRKL